MAKKKLTKKEEGKKRAQVLEKSKNAAKKLKGEVNNAMNTAIIAAFGFLMALVWRDVITEFVDRISSTSPVQGKLFSALIVTLICVIGILIVSRVFKKQE